MGLIAVGQIAPVLNCCIADVKASLSKPLLCDILSLKTLYLKLLLLFKNHENTANAITIHDITQKFREIVVGFMKIQHNIHNFVK